jgi:NTP pyrophosphatase (non-canonical NTP hydrolase)
MAQTHRNQSIRQFQALNAKIYGLPNDQIYSIFDLLTQMQRFTMRALKGIRKDDTTKLRTNLLISFSWMMAIANRMHIDVEEQIWKRFPALCSYCGFAPCKCKKIHPKKRIKIKIDQPRRPTTMNGFQEMFRSIYPPESRTVSDAGVHLAEETGEVGEAIHNFLGQHLQKQFDDIELEIADYASCIFGVANSAPFDIAPELEKMFKNGCHVCHKTPCICRFSEVVIFKS